MKNSKSIIVVLILIIVVLLALLVSEREKPSLRKDGIFLDSDVLEDSKFIANKGWHKAYEDALADEVRAKLPKWPEIPKDKKASYDSLAEFLKVAENNLQEAIVAASGGLLTTKPGNSRAGADDVSYIRIEGVEYCVYGRTLYLQAEQRNTNPNDRWKCEWTHDPGGIVPDLTTSFEAHLVQKVTWR